MIPLLPFIGPWLVRKLIGRVGATWAPRIAQGVTLVLGAALLWLAISAAIGAIRADARADLLAEQAAAQAKADAAQRARERQAADRRTDELKIGAATDAAQQKELTDATQDLPDSRPSARQRARVCVELRRAAKAAGRAEPAC